jgi:hypothetical protein
MWTRTIAQRSATMLANGNALRESSARGTAVRREGSRRVERGVSQRSAVLWLDERRAPRRAEFRPTRCDHFRSIARTNLRSTKVRLSPHLVTPITLRQDWTSRRDMTTLTLRPPASVNARTWARYQRKGDGLHVLGVCTPRSMISPRLGGPRRFEGRKSWRKCFLSAAYLPQICQLRSVQNRV